MAIREMAVSKSGKLAIICAVIGLALVLGIGLVSCSGIASVGGIGANQAVADAAGGVVEDVGLLEPETEPIGQEVDDGAEVEKAESVPSDEAAGHDEAAYSQGSAEDSQRRGSTAKSKDNSTAPSQNTSQKTWVEETERVGEPVRYRVYGRSGSRVHGDDAAQDHGEADEQDQNDESCDADGTEALQVPEPDLARLLESEECQRDRGERRHDVELYRARPADDERHDVRDEHDEPADDRDDEQRQERRQVVIARYDRDCRHVQCAASAEEALHTVYRKAYDLVDGRHEVEGVLDQEKEYCEEHEEEHHLLHAREGLVAVHAL